MGGTSIAAVADAGGSPFERADVRLEARLRLLAPPLAFAAAFLMMASPLGRLLSRIFISMWIHELGHAVTAWLCGFGAIPGPWRTALSSGRKPIVAIVLAAGLGFVVWRAWRAERRSLAAAAVTMLLVQLVFTLGLSHQRASMLITFGGDGGMLVLGALLAACFYVPRESYLYRNALRWGFLGFGAFAFADAAVSWWAARADRASIPFGEIEGVGLSDPTKLVELYGWSLDQLVGRYVALSLVCGLGLLALWAVVALRDRRALWRSSP